MYRWVSFHDVLSIPELKEAVLFDDMATFYEALHEAGFDINQDVDIESCYHRTLQGKVVHGPRVISQERRDEEWLNSGYATDEAWKISLGKRDVHLLREIEEMSKQSNFTGQLVEHLENYWGAGGADASIEVGL